MLVATAGCGRGPPAPAAASAPAESDARAPELAGGPPLSHPAPIELAQAPVIQPVRAPALASDIAPPAAALPPAPATTPATTTETTGAPEIADPLQRLNRPMFKVDQALRHSSLARASLPPKPPRRVRRALANVLRNMDEPTTVANQTLQRKPVRALRSAARFVINSTLGVAGLFDVAQRLGLKPSRTDFGQTLASYGVGPGAYLYLPIRGPTNLRDVVGAFADTYFWPLHWVSAGWIAQPAVAVARLESTPRTADDFRYAAASPQAPVDPYLAERRAYAQSRQAELHPRAGRPAIIPPRLALQLVSARQSAAGPAP